MRRLRIAGPTSWLLPSCMVLAALTSPSATPATTGEATSTTGSSISTALIGTTTTGLPATASTSAGPTVVTQLPPPAKTCGVERWAVKTGMDSDAAKVDQANVVASSVGALSALPAPAHPTARVSPTETTVFSVHATLTKFKLEADDSDYHLVLDDGEGRTMITEIPSADCIGASPFRTAIGDVRAIVYTRLHPGPSFKATRIPVTVTGVGFFDAIHGQTGVAPNGIELHPVLSISFG